MKEFSEDDVKIMQKTAKAVYNHYLTINPLDENVISDFEQYLKGRLDEEFTFEERLDLYNLTRDNLVAEYSAKLRNNI
ncbi:hypothetical protein V1389_02130 [Flavobacterium rakeshii]|uniref:hypothetical protein n=1 Tax=Flavobacterium rakeshii TaxID=1038845 RepID=UPI002E7B0213|nr:hypothetical protein [Flavobacterium rakeshii]MEE1897115.1 hypothetical protein [Flavobacterium rakeshii]